MLPDLRETHTDSQFEICFSVDRSDMFVGNCCLSITLWISVTHTAYCLQLNRASMVCLEEHNAEEGKKIFLGTHDIWFFSSVQKVCYILSGRKLDCFDMIALDKFTLDIIHILIIFQMLTNSLSMYYSIFPLIEDKLIGLRFPGFLFLSLFFKASFLNIDITFATSLFFFSFQFLHCPL